MDEKLIFYILEDHRGG